MNTSKKSNGLMGDLESIKALLEEEVEEEVEEDGSEPMSDASSQMIDQPFDIDAR